MNFETTERKTIEAIKNVTGMEKRLEEQPTIIASRTADINKKAADKNSEKMADKNREKIADRNDEKTADKIARSLEDGRQKQQV